MTGVFEELMIGSMKLTNRIIRSATHEGFTDSNNNPNDDMLALYEKLSSGGAGAIITGYAGVRRDGMAPTPNMLMFDSDEHIEGFRKITDGIDQTKTPLILQLVHCGRQTRGVITGHRPIAPSALKDGLYNEEKPLELTPPEIRGVIQSFADAAERAKKAGFSGVEIHAAHGYLLSSFLSPHMNRRKDDWGGSTRNRFKIVEEIAKEIRSRIGNFPMLIKINCFEKSRNGIKTVDAVKIAKLCESAGFDAIEVSCGIMEEGMIMCRGDIPMETMMKTTFRFKEMSSITKAFAKPYVKMTMGSPKPLNLYNLEAATEIRKNVSIPVIVVGGIRELPDIERIVSENMCDAVSMSRPFIAEPDIINKLRNGRSSECTNCNKCLVRAEGHTLRCYRA